MDWQVLWKDQFLRYMILALIVLGGVLAFAPQQTAQVEGDLVMFYLPTCPHCHDEQEFLETLEDVDIVQIDVSTRQGQQQYIETLTALGEPPEQIRVPVTIIGNNIIRGFDTAETTGAAIVQALEGETLAVEAEECSATSDCTQPIDVNLLGWKFSITPSDFSLPVLAIILGAVDGFNPCAMWVLVYLISLVVMLKDKRRAWLLIGLFLAASGILYFLFMSLWLNVFLFIGFLRPVQILIGLFALGVGLANLREYIFTKGPLACKVGDFGKRKKTMDKASSVINAPLTVASIGAMIVLAFAVNSIEFMCSFGIPAVFSQVLAVSGASSFAQYGLIGLYVLMYMIDDLIIFGLAVFAVNSSFGDKYAKQCKLLAGLLLLVLGVLLLFFPEILASFG